MCVEFFLFFQAEDGIRDLVRSRGLGDVYKRQVLNKPPGLATQGGTKTDAHVDGLLDALKFDGPTLSLIHI